MKRHEEIAAYIREKIKNLEWNIGEQIPTEKELAEQFEASRPTVRQALERLKTEGYLVRYKGKGTFVTKPRSKQRHESTTFIAGYKKECEKKHQELVTKVLSLKVEKADGEIAQKLEIPSGSKVICLVRLRKIRSAVQEQIVLYTTVYVPYKSFEFLMEEDFTQKSFYETMEEHGKRVIHASRCLEVRMPEPKIQNALQLGAFEPTVYISSVGKTALNEVVEYSLSYYPAESSQFLIEVDK